MNRNDIISLLIERETGRVFAGAPIWDEIENAAGRYEGEDGEVWLTGQDDVLMKWEYLVEMKRIHDEDLDQWATDLSLKEIRIEDRENHKNWSVAVQGATL